MVVLESKGVNSGSYVVGSGAQASHDTVVIADLSAIGRARAAFQPRYTLSGQVPGSGTFLAPHEAYVVGGSVYYIDGYGSVFRIGFDGNPVVVTRFPTKLGSQTVSFAVSPDGCELAASILSSPCSFEILAATTGNPAHTIRPFESACDNPVLAGWDAVGPIVVLGSNPVSPPPARVQLESQDFDGGTVAHLGADGRYGAAVSLPTSCQLSNVSAAGVVICSEVLSGAPDPSPPTSCPALASGSMGLGITTVRSSDSATLARVQFAVCTQSSLSGPSVAVGPNGLFAISGRTNGSGDAFADGQWQGPGGTRGLFSYQFLPEAWVDSTTLFGRLGYNTNRDAAFVTLGKSGWDDLGFMGDYVGML